MAKIVKIRVSKRGPTGALDPADRARVNAAIETAENVEAIVEDVTDAAGTATTAATTATQRAVEAGQSAAASAARAGEAQTSAGAAAGSAGAADAARLAAETYALAGATAAKYYDTISDGRAAVADGATFGVRAGGTDGLTRATLYRRNSAASHTALVAQMPAGQFDAAASIGEALSLVTDSGASTATAYVCTVRSAHAILTIGTNSLLNFAPHTTSGEAPTLTVSGVTREIKDIAGAALPAGALVAGAAYMLRVYSATECRLHNQALSVAQARTLAGLSDGYRIRNSAASLARPGDNPALFARSYISGPDAAPALSFPVVDLGAAGGKVVEFGNNSMSLRERLPFGSGQRYRFLLRFRVTVDSTETGDNVTVLIRTMTDDYAGLALTAVWSGRVAIADGWRTVEVDTGTMMLPATATLITPVIRHNLASGSMQVQIMETIRVTASGGGAATEQWTPAIRPNAQLQIHNDYPVYRNFVEIPYAPLVLSGSTGYYTYAWPHPRVCVMAESGRRLDLTHMVRGTSLRYIVRTGTGGIFAGFGRTFFGQGGANYVTVPAGSIVDVTYDASTSYTYLTVIPVVGAPVFSTIAEPIADKSILYAGQSLSAQAYQMGGPGGFYHAQQSGWGGVTPIRDLVRFILAAEGGTTIDKRGNTTRYWWDRDTDSAGPVLLDYIAAVNAALAAGHPRPVACFWNQGQSDATYISQGTYGYADYYSQLLKVWDYLQANALAGVGKFLVTTISRADRTSHNLGATAVREAQLTAIAARADCTQGSEQYDLSGEGGLDVHLSPKGYFTGDYRLFRAWHNAINGAALSMGPRVASVTRTDDTTVVITLSGASRMPVGRGMRSGVNIDFGPNPFLWGAIPAGQHGDQGQIEFVEGSISGTTITLKAKSSLVGARLVYPYGYANGWREALHPTDGEAHLDYDGQPLRSYISAPLT